MAVSTRRRAEGFTIVELLVAIAIIGLLVALLMPAVQAGREAARRMTCQNHLRQIGLAVLHHHDSLGHFPSSGNNGTITRYGSTPATATSVPFQQAGTLFQILPYLEQRGAWQGEEADARGLVVPTYYCPSRRAPVSRLAPDGRPVGLNDYAMPVWKDATAGPGMGGNSAGCWNWWRDGIGDSLNHPYYRNTVFFRGGKDSTRFPPSRIAHISDGTSSVLMVSEKFVDPTRYNPAPLADDPPQWPWPTLSFTDNGYFDGWNWATMRCSMYGPVRDQHYTQIAYWQMFGSAHPEGVNAVFADGSVRSISYGIPNALFQLLCRRDTGLVIDLTGY